MKMRIASLSLLTVCCLMLAVAPAMADTLYSNGPYNGNTSAWNIGFGFSVTDSISSTPDTFATGLSIVTWDSPGDTLLNAEVQFGTASFGNNIFDSVLTPTLTRDIGINQYGYELDQWTFSFFTFLPAGTNWVTLQNEQSAFGLSIYWDENSGPSSAYENTLGSIPSEAFTLTGFHEGTPEPSSISLFGSGIFGLAGILRRKLNH